MNEREEERTMNEREEERDRELGMRGGKRGIERVTEQQHSQSTVIIS